MPLGALHRSPAKHKATAALCLEPVSIVSQAASLHWGLKRAHAAQDVVATEGAVLEEAGELAEAERMYLAFDDPDGALAMWHAHHRFDAAVDLVARVRPVRSFPCIRLGRAHAACLIGVVAFHVW